jgi:steroid 5-alpha reductase family enzyme
MRKRWGQRFPIISLFTVFGLQGMIMWVVSLPVQLVMTKSDSDIGLLAVLGAVLWAIGLAFEAIGDAQLTRFKSNPSNAGKVMNRGLWRYTRHPNYFGDACVWWGLAIIALTVTPWGLVGAALMHLFLRRVSGVTLLEKSLVKRREGYAEYIKVTSPFIPRPPKKS